MINSANVGAFLLFARMLTRVTMLDIYSNTNEKLVCLLPYALLLTITESSFTITESSSPSTSLSVSSVKSIDRASVSQCLKSAWCSTPKSNFNSLSLSDASVRFNADPNVTRFFWIVNRVPFGEGRNRSADHIITEYLFSVASYAFSAFVCDFGQ